jgi:DNA-binding phage protein
VIPKAPPGWSVNFFEETEEPLPVREWMRGLPKEVRAKLLARIQMQDPEVRATCEEETRLLTIGMELAKQRMSKGLTQAQLATAMGTSTPQLSRTERRPGNVTMRTLMRYADAMGMELDIKLVAKQQ